MIGRHDTVPALELPAAAPPEVPDTELWQRLQALRGEMDQDEIDLVVLTSQKNIEYFTGYRSLSWAYHSRPLFCILDRHSIRLVASRTETRNLQLRERGFEWIFYDGYLAEAVARLRELIAGPSRLGTLRIAIDYGQDMFGRGSLELLDGLRSISGGRAPCSASSAIWRVRMIKTEFEINLKRTALEIVDRAFDEAVSDARLGISEVELARAVQARTMSFGADSADPIAMVFGRGEFAYNRWPDDRRLKHGDYVWTDFRATYGGYPADRNRIARAGRPEPWELECYHDIRSLTVCLARSVKAGMSCGELYAEFETLWKQVGLPPAYGLVSRIGHGGGLDVTEPPSIARNDPTLIEPGMILHLEPKLERDGAVFQFEEVVHVGDAGITFLSRLSPEDMPVIE